MAKAKEIGTTPSCVAIRNVLSRMPNSAAVRFVIQNGMTGQQAHEQQVREGFRPESGSQLLDAGAGPAQKRLPDGRTGDQKDADRSERRPKSRQRASDRPSEEKTARHAEKEGSRNGEGNDRDVDQEIEARRCDRVRGDQTADPERDVSQGFRG